jgi:hypothetical protein
MDWFGGLSTLVEKHKLIRRLMMLWMMALTTHIFLWSIEFVTTTTKSGAEVGLMIGAITGPLALLQGHVFKLYNEARKEADNG